MAIKIKHKIDYNKLILIILIIMMVLPSDFSNLPISIAKMTSIIIIAIFMYFIKKEKIYKIDIIFLLGNLIFIVAILLSLLVNFNTIKLNDFLEPVKYIIFAMITIIIMTICRIKEYYVYFLKLISIIMIVICIFGIIQYFNPFSINELYIKIYAPTQYETLINDYPTPRIVGIKSNPAVYALLVSMGVYFNLIYYKYAKNKSICRISMLLCGINLMMTLTRTVQIAFILSVIAWIFVKFLDRKGLKKAIIITLIAICTIVLFIHILPKSMTWRLTQILDISHATSWIARTSKWKSYYEIIMKNMLFGIGPVKNYVTELGYIDSELVQNLLQYGFIGFGAYLIMLFWPIYQYIKNKSNKKIIKYYIPILILILINNISSTSLISYETAIAIYIIMGLILTNFKENEMYE